MRCLLACFVQLWLIAALSFSQDMAAPVHHLSRTLPVETPRCQLSAERPQARIPAIAQPPSTDLAASTRTWKLLRPYPELSFTISPSQPQKLVMPPVNTVRFGKQRMAETNWVQVLSAGDN